MKYGIIGGFLFGIMALAQWFVPVKMIYDSQEIIRKGEAFHFKCEPIDPNDPFRGKFITLRFAIESFETDTSHPYKEGQQVYALLKKDSAGMVTIDRLQPTEPSSEKNYLKLNIDYLNNYNQNIADIHFEIPFNRFYMDEWAAPKAELAYRENVVVEKGIPTYGVVYVYKGEARLKDVMIGEKSIREFIKTYPAVYQEGD